MIDAADDLRGDATRLRNEELNKGKRKDGEGGASDFDKINILEEFLDMT